MHGPSRTPRRLSASRPLLRRRDANGTEPDLARPPGLPRRMLRRGRAIRRGVSVALWTAIAMLVQAPLVVLPGRPKVMFARLYWSVFCRLLGLKVRVIGQAATGSGRPVVFVSNHSSWLDVPVLGGRLEACFVAKDQVARWPVIGTVARLGRSVFVSRQRATTRRERDAMSARVVDGDSLILFPEGTTSDGSRVLPFRSAFFSVVEGGQPPLVQPVSVVYDRLAGLPTGRASRPLFAWYGDMDIASHFWRLSQHRGLRASVLLHAPLDPSSFANRKALAQAVWSAVADGASTLRQNRPASPLGGAPATPGAWVEEPTGPVFA